MLTVKDKSEYLRGMFILIRIDNKITLYEKNALITISKILDFNRKFCTDALDELLENTFIIESPPKFSTQIIGETFINDSIKLAFSDQEFHLNERGWIRNTAKNNNIGKDYFENKINEYENNESVQLTNYVFDVEKLIVN